MSLSTDPYSQCSAIFRCEGVAAVVIEAGALYFGLFLRRLFGEIIVLPLFAWVLDEAWRRRRRFRLNLVAVLLAPEVLAILPAYRAVNVSEDGESNRPDFTRETRGVITIARAVPLVLL